jgi:hypothetical protein
LERASTAFNKLGSERRECAAESTAATHVRIDHMLAASPAVIYSTEATGNYACTFVSDNLRTIFGYEPEETYAEFLPQTALNLLGF